MSYPVPAPEADSYGTVAGVAAYVGVYTDDGEFNATTTPTYARVTIWLDQVSDMMNIALSQAGFSTPVSQTDARSAIGAFIEQLVSDLCHYANSKGRFFSKTGSGGSSAMTLMWDELSKWVAGNAVGLENLGISRTKSTVGVIATKGFDAAGRPLAPIFQRSGFGNIFEDWAGRGNS